MVSHEHRDEALSLIFNIILRLVISRIEDEERGSSLVKFITSRCCSIRVPEFSHVVKATCSQPASAIGTVTLSLERSCNGINLELTGRKIVHSCGIAAEGSCQLSLL